MFDWLRNMGKSKDDRRFQILDERLIDLQGGLKKLKQEVNEQAHSNRGRFDKIESLLRFGFQQVLDAVSKITALTPTKQLEVKFVFKVANDHQDEPFSISVGGVTDAEGESIPDASGLTVAVSSSDEDVVGVSFDPSTKSGSVHFGHSGVASVTASVTNAKGEILGSGAADFTVTTGDPAAVSDVRLAFAGLTEEPPAEPGG